MSYFTMKTYVVTLYQNRLTYVLILHQNRLDETVLMRGHYIYFRQEIRKKYFRIVLKNPTLSGALYIASLYSAFA